MPSDVPSIEQRVRAAVGAAALTLLLLGGVGSVVAAGVRLLLASLGVL